MSRYHQMAYSSPEEMVFGRSLYPVKCGLDLEIGSNAVIPELKYAPRPGAEVSYESIYDEYRRITKDALERAVSLGLPALVLELEHVFQLSANPQWGAGVARMTKELMEEYHRKYGLKSAQRATIADFRRASLGLRGSQELKTMLEAFDRSATAGADILSIESTGGKEVFNYCVTRHDIQGMLFGVGLLGSIDMEFLWKQVVDIADRHGVVPGGDTDCAHANSAMFLAGGLLETQLSHVFAALVRAVGAARSLVAFEQGARGPDKDCGYEGVVLKAITGCPISMEGKASACAHSDLMGNLVAATCDLWSNEAVEYAEMFGGTTPQVFTEILGYDTAQMNTALQTGTEKVLRDIFILSDKYRDPQAFVLAPDIAYQIGQAIVSEEDYYRRSRKALLKAAELIDQACRAGKLSLTKGEQKTLADCVATVNALPEDTEEFIAKCIRDYAVIDDFRPENYGLKGA